MKRIWMAGALGAMLLMLAACGAPAEGRGTDPVALGETLLQQGQDLPAMSVVTSQDEDGEGLFPYLSDLAYDKVEGYYFAYAAGGTAEEIAVIRLKDSADGAQARASLERHLEDRLGIFRVYDPEQVPAVEDARILVEGEMVAMLICPNSGELEQTFRQAGEQTFD